MFPHRFLTLPPSPQHDGVTAVRSYMPHVLGKTDRVNYGLLTEDEVTAVRERMRLGTSRMSAKRLLVAVPFTGKDVPSRCATPRHAALCTCSCDANTVMFDLDPGLLPSAGLPSTPTPRC